jgi:hypothetical protein
MKLKRPPQSMRFSLMERLNEVADRAASAAGRKGPERGPFQFLARRIANPP